MRIALYVHFWFLKNPLLNMMALNNYHLYKNITLYLTGLDCYDIYIYNCIYNFVSIESWMIDVIKYGHTSLIYIVQKVCTAAYDYIHVQLWIFIPYNSMTAQKLYAIVYGPYVWVIHLHESNKTLYALPLFKKLCFYSILMYKLVNTNNSFPRIFCRNRQTRNHCWLKLLLPCTSRSCNKAPKQISPCHSKQTSHSPSLPNKPISRVEKNTNSSLRAHFPEKRIQNSIRNKSASRVVQSNPITLPPTGPINCRHFQGTRPIYVGAVYFSRNALHKVVTVERLLAWSDEEKIQRADEIDWLIDCPCAPGKLGCQVGDVFGIAECLDAREKLRMYGEREGNNPRSVGYELRFFLDSWESRSRGCWTRRSRKRRFSR